MATTRNDLVFSPPIAEFCEQQKGKSLTVLSGANNSGKSLVMKSLKRQFGVSGWATHIDNAGALMARGSS